MSSDKILAGWKEHVPAEVPLDDVLRVIDERFEKRLPTEGGHYKVFDSRLLRFRKKFPEYPAECFNGVFHIPTVKGRKVKGRYIDRILELLEIVESMTEKGL